MLSSELLASSNENVLPCFPICRSHCSPVAASTGSAFQSLLQGVLDGLSEQSIISKDVEAEILRMADSSTPGPSFAAQSKAKYAVLACVSSRWRRREDKDEAVGNGSLMDADEVIPTTITSSSSRAVAVDTLRRVESELQVQNLTVQFDHAIKKHKTEIDTLRAENNRFEASFRKILEEEISECRRIERSKLAEAETSLKSERAKRLTLQTELAELDSRHRAVVEELELQVLELERRLEAMQLETTRVRVQAQHPRL